ncbi:MAG: hypothetical protein WDA70_07875 [Lysobacteraceae bacterium]
MSPSLFVLIPALACALFALMLIVGMRRRPVFRSRTGNGLRGLFAFAFALAAIGLIGLALSLHHYLTLEREVTVARLAFQAHGPQHFTATLDTADGRRREFTLRGDEWQLDARVISWKLPALLAGAPPLYRLERISGRYRDIRAEREAERSVHALDEDALLDLWTIKQQFPRWLPFVDAHHGSAAYLPMLDGARFEVTLGGRGGLVARPADDTTRLKLEQSGWFGGP